MPQIDELYETIRTQGEELNKLRPIARAAHEYIEAGEAEAERVARTARISDPKSPEWQRKQDAHIALIAAVRA